MKNSIQICDDLTAIIVSATLRWSHKPTNSFGRPGGHYQRTVGAAITKAKRALNAWEYDEASTKAFIQDAHDLAALKINAD